MPSCCDRRPVARERLLGGLLLVALVPLELAAASLSFETLGELASLFTYFLVLLNVPLAAVVFWRPLAGSLLAVALGLAVVPRQAHLGQRLLGLQQEAAAIVTYAYEVHRRTGRFPAALDEYEPERNELMPFFRYSEDPARGGFLLLFHVGTPATSHGYTPVSGWWYYPD